MLITDFFEYLYFENPFKKNYMKKSIFAMVALVSLIVFQSSGQKVSTEFRLTLRDGSVMTGTSSLSNINLVTAWGALIFR